MANQDSRHHCYVSRILSVLTGVLGKSTDNFLILKRLAKDYNRLHWTIQEQWNKIIFSDEMWCELGKNSRVYVW
jgi:hypothetical protein